MQLQDTAESDMHSEVPLTPTIFMERSGAAMADRVAVVHEGKMLSFRALLRRTRCLAQALLRLQVAPGDSVAVLAENCIEIIEAHFAIPSVGARIVMLNPYLPAGELEQLLEHCAAKVLIGDAASLAKLSVAWRPGSRRHHVVVISRHTESFADALQYDACLEREDGSRPLDQSIDSELTPIAINFTSGTTGQPKGVVYSHRGAYLHALGQVLMFGLGVNSRYLWTLPMFHVNGWGHMWACVAIGCSQTVVRIAEISQQPGGLTALIDESRITHLAGAPRLIQRLAEPTQQQVALQGLTVMTGGAAPPPRLLQQLEQYGVNVIHQYGLSETCGPFVVCEEQPGWQGLPSESRAVLRARQGVTAIHAGTGVRVVSESGADVPRDGRSLGEVVMRGNSVAIGYYKNPEATARAFRDGWFHTGDVAVVHPDGYLEIRDRAKDLIYVETEYGWENISSLEVEKALFRNSRVSDAAVVGVPAGLEGGAASLIAFIEVTAGQELTEQELRAHCREALPAYMRPGAFYFEQIPKTTTGKIRKDVLAREAARRLNTRAAVATS
jgi:fatty-acyl-CoA synthase